MSRRLRRYFSGNGCLQGIKHNRLSDTNQVSWRDCNFDGYSRLDIAYDTGTGRFDSRGVNRRLRNSGNSLRRKVDKYRSMLDG